MECRFLVALFVLCLLLRGSDSETFSWKLLHRYSDEAKSIWRSRIPNHPTTTTTTTETGVDDTNTLEYYRLLLSKDLKRHKMKLASHYQLLFPSQGSETLFFGNELDWLHYTWIDIGTPNVSFLVALDTGSDLLWVPCDCIECASLLATHYDALDKNLSEYSPSRSSSSKHLSCSNKLCSSSSNCDSSKDLCPYIAKYASENTSSSGFLVQDKLHLSSVDRGEPKSSVRASIIIGCGRKQSGAYLEGAAPDGVMGLGLGNLSVPSFLAAAGLVRNSFSICFDKNSSGKIFFGGEKDPRGKSTSFLSIPGNYDNYFVALESFCVGSSCFKDTEFKALVDTGTSFTYFPYNAYKKVVTEFDRQVGSERINIEGSPWKYCYNASLQVFDKIPSFKVFFTRGQSFNIHDPVFPTAFNKFSLSYGLTGTDIAKSLIPHKRIYCDNSNLGDKPAAAISLMLYFFFVMIVCPFFGFSIFCVTLLYTDDDFGIIGQNFMQGYHMVFDRENLTFSWSVSNCEDASPARSGQPSPPSGEAMNPLPTNEQQNLPSRSPPALPEKTTPKSTATTTLQNPIQIQFVFLLLHLLLINLLAQGI